jgi:hypothetical protein
VFIMILTKATVVLLQSKQIFFLFKESKLFSVCVIGTEYLCVNYLILVFQSLGNKQILS